MNSRLLFILFFGLGVTSLYNCSSSKNLNLFLSDEYRQNVPVKSIPDLNVDTKIIGGRGGKVYHVTNLNDSGFGSLRYGMEELEGARNIVFDVSGMIFVKSNIKVFHPFLTVYGQTAPGDITLIGGGISIRANNVIVQHLCVRPGDGLQGQSPSTRDGIEVLSLDEPVSDVLIDHCSVSHSIDENIGIWGDCSNVVISNCLIYAGLNASIHPKGPHSKGVLIGSGGKEIWFHRNVLAFNIERNPRLSGNSSVRFDENIVYMCERGVQILGSPTNDFVSFSASNNIFYPENKYNIRIKKISENSIVELNNNLEVSKIENQILTKYERPSKRNTSVISSKSQLEKEILSYSGANPTRRNATDQNMIQLIKERKGKVYDCTSNEVVLGRGVITKYNKSKYEVRLSENNITSSLESELFLKAGSDIIPIRKISVVKSYKNAYELILGNSLRDNVNHVEVIRKCNSVLPIVYSASKKEKLKYPKAHEVDDDGNGYSALEDLIYNQ